MINADEIAGILKQQIASFKADIQEDQVGTVIEVGANLARVYGLQGVRASELVEFPNGIQGVALNLEEDNVGVVIMGDDEQIKEGDKVRRTGRIASSFIRSKSVVPPARNAALASAAASRMASSALLART